MGPPRGPDFGSARASASASSDAKTSHSPRQTNAAKMRPLQQKPDTEVSHTPAARGARKPTRFSFGFPPLEALHRRGPPCSGNVFAAKSGPQSCPRAKSGKPNPNCKKLRYKHQPFSPLPPPSSMLQTVTRAKLLRPRQLFSKRCVTQKLAAFVYKRNIEIGGEGGTRRSSDLSTARVCHRRLQTLKLRHALARFMTSHTGASCTWSRSACFCCVFSVLIPLSSSYSVLIPVLIPVLIHDFAGRATRTKLSVSRKKGENVFAFFKSIHRKLVSCGPASKTVNKNWNKNWNKN